MDNPPDVARWIKLFFLLSSVQNRNITNPAETRLPVKIDNEAFDYSKHIKDYALNIYNASVIDAKIHQAGQESDFGNHSHGDIKNAMGLSSEDTILYSWFQQEEKLKGK